MRPFCAQVFLALLLFAGLASAQEPHRLFRVPFRTVNGMILLDARVNDKPAVLLLDTGSDFTLISPQASGLSTAKLRALTVPSPAQEPFKLEAPKPKTDRKVFFAGVSLLAASKAADAITTRQLLDRGGHENNPIFGPHPSPAKQSLINLGFFAAETGALYLTEHNHHAWVPLDRAGFPGHSSRTRSPCSL